MRALWTEWRTRRQLRACDTVGRGVVALGTVTVQNLGGITIADGVRFESHAATSHVVTGPNGHVNIGANVTIGHGAAIAAHASIVIGSGAHLGPFVMLLDTDFHEAGKHDSSGGSSPIAIGAGARLGARVTVLRGSTVGAGAIVAAGSVVKGDVEPGARVAGNPARRVLENSGDTEAMGVSVDAVVSVVTSTFGLRQSLTADTARDAIAQWDSLGALNLLLSLEETFGVSISSDQMARVQSIGDVVAVLDDAVARTAGR